RRRNFASLEIGRSFVEIRATWWIILSASETKEQRADERPVDEVLKPFIDRYLSQHSPVLGRTRCPAPHLWLSANDGSRISDKRLASVLRMTTLSTVGVALSPHMFRTCGASTAAILGGENPYLASALLDHTDVRITELHYNRASSLSAAGRFREI